MKRYTKSEHIQNGCISAERKRLDGTVEDHRHDFFEIEYIISGNGTYIIDGVCYPVRPGLLFFMTPANFHRVEMHSAELYNVMFSGDMCGFTALSELAEVSPVVAETTKSDRAFYACVLDELAKKASDLELSSALINAVVAKLASDKALGKSTAKSSSIKGLELFILNNFRQRLTLDDASKIANLSPSYLSHLFKKETGMNFKAYLDQMRFSYAEKLLAFTDMTVLEVCTECGFDDYPNFLRRFRQKNGVYPIAYRTAKKNN